MLSPALLRAQSSTNLPTPAALTGVIQGSDGNYYSPTEPNGREVYCDVPSGGYNTCGAIYQVTPTGTVKLLLDLSPALKTNGSAPNPLIEGPDGDFYGTTSTGGPDACSCGVFYKVTASGTFTILHVFEAADFQQTFSYYLGSSTGHLVLGSDGNFYGYTAPQFAGVVYRLTPQGQFTLLHSFAATVAQGGGSTPSGLIEGSDGQFFLTMLGDTGSPDPSTHSGGFLYKMTTAGDLTLVGTFPGDLSLGYDPNGDLAIGPDGSLYGVTRGGGGNYNSALPTIYKYTPGAGVQTLYTFPFVAGAKGSYAENGNYLRSGLILGSDGYLYGTSQYGTSPACYSGCGTAFRISTTGAFKVIHEFQGGTDGGNPFGPIIQSSDGTITGSNGGITAAGATPTPVGTIYKLEEAAPPPIQLSFVANGQGVSSAKISQTLTLNWKVLNAFSNTAQQCYAFVQGPAQTPASTWAGQQKGTLASDVFSGSLTFTAPTTVGTYVYTLTCAGAESGSATLTVGNTINIDTGSLSNATVSRSYTAALQATGGIGQLQWSATGKLPDGLTIDPVGGYLLGTPTQFGDYQVTITVQDTSTPPLHASATFPLHVDSGLKLASTLPNAIEGKVYTATATATGGRPPYNWILGSGNTLPDGLALNTTTGVIFGTPTKAGKFTFLLTVQDSEGNAAEVTRTYTISTTPTPLMVSNTGGAFPDCTVNVLCQQNGFEATGGTPPYTWTVAPGTSFPPGLTLTPNGLVVGKPTQFTQLSSDYILTVQVTDSATPALTTTGTATLAVNSGLQILSIPLPVATVGVRYQSPPPVVTGGIPPYTWMIVPDDSSLLHEYTRNPDGSIFSASPKTPGVFLTHYTVFDSEGTHADAILDATLIVIAPPTPSTTVLTASSVTTGTGMNVTLTATVSSTGGIPTGSVNFLNGTTSLGTAMLDETGTASLTTTFSSAGVETLSAAYSGTTTIAGSNSASITETVVTPTVSAAFSPGTLTIASGSSGSLTLTLTPVGGFTGTVSLSCGTTLPPHVACTFVPGSVTIAAGATSATDVLTITTSSPTMGKLQGPFGNSKLGAVLAFGLPLSLLGLVGLRRRGTAMPRPATWVLLVCMASGATTLLTGCGSTRASTPKGTYNVPITLNLPGGQTQATTVSVIID